MQKIAILLSLIFLFFQFSPAKAQSPERAFYNDVEAGNVSSGIALIVGENLWFRPMTRGLEPMKTDSGLKIYGCTAAVNNVVETYGLDDGHIFPVDPAMKALTGAEVFFWKVDAALPDTSSPSWQFIPTRDATGGSWVDHIVWTGSHPVDCNGPDIVPPERAGDDDGLDEEFFRELEDVLNAPNKNEQLGLEPEPEPAGALTFVLVILGLVALLIGALLLLRRLPIFRQTVTQ